MEKIKLCDEGATLLAEAMLKTCADDYKYCWLVKTKRNGGDWIFAGHVPRKGNPELKFISPTRDHPLIGSVDDNISSMERFLRNHQTLSEISEDVINHLRKEAENDKKLNRKVGKLKYVQIRNAAAGICSDVPA